MKRIIIILSVFALGAISANAQSSLLDAFKKAAGSVATTAAQSAAQAAQNEASAAAASAGLSTTTQDILTGVLGSLAGDLLNTYTTITLAGDWKYNGAATGIQSNNTLVSLASSSYKNKLDTKINSYLAKAGIKPGSAVFSFAQDGTFTLASGAKTIAGGTYVQNGKDVQMKFGKLYNYLTIDGVIAVTPTGCQILCDASKFLNFVNSAIKVAGSFVNTSSITSLFEQVDGLQLGFNLSK